jgi:hypothetical protein
VNRLGEILMDYKYDNVFEDAEHIAAVIAQGRKQGKDKKNPLSIQEGGEHYKSMKIQPVEFIHTNNIPFIEGAIIKYLCRHKRKNGLEDLRKAKHFIDLLIQLEYEYD